MPRLDDFDRPAEDFVVIHTTPEMNAEASVLLTNAAYARFERSPGMGYREDRRLMLRALCSTFSALEKDICVTDHYPEPYMVRFIHPHHRNAAVARRDFDFEGHRIHVRPWRWEENAEQVNMMFHVRLCIENVPLYAWNEGVAQQIIGRACSLDYIESSCMNRDYTKALCLWAWAESPALVQRVRWVTLPGRSAVPGIPERGRRGLQRRCIIHLDIVEDMSGPVDAQPPTPGKLDWRWGHVDGERHLRDRTERLQCAEDGRGSRGHRDDDDSDRGGRGRDSSRGWRETLQRSLSRNARSRGRDGGREGQDQGRERDRSSHRGEGRRRHALDEAAAAAALLGADAATDDLEPQVRGRTRARSAAPHASRRQSIAARTPPATPDPPSSPNSVCPSPPSPKGGSQPLLLITRGEAVSPALISLSASSGNSLTRGALELLAPSSLVAAASPVRPPGFDSSPVQSTPPFISDLPGQPASEEQALAPIFTAMQQPLLSPPTSSPPVRPANRRKTLAGMEVCRTVGFSLRRPSARVKTKRPAAPVARAAETLVCRTLGIIQNGEEITELALAEFARRFEGQVDDKVLSALKVLFKVDSPDAHALEQALLSHGGSAALDHEVVPADDNA
jgi:hypothetical protein